ncbi:MAG: thiosulfate oxidation carrier complex protein SoxZ [Burkholderiales bacterium]|nr:thiosulfate oxidation carrier complex protein SoxZ [Burkholderiales bacterium]MDP2399633.1 thiosulfate oxidation carrier complex protein SoxZ [Burkholderiales bacterium]
MLSRVQVPASARRGEIVQLRIAIQHPMETGYRPDHFGRRIPKNVINTLVCRYNGVEVFRAEMGSGIAANPLLQFPVRVQDSGEFVFEWRDDSGEQGESRAVITISAG